VIDRSSTGRACRALTLIETYEGKVKMDTLGTVLYEIENLGRNLVRVLWMNGQTMSVLSSEIEIIGKEGAHVE